MQELEKTANENIDERNDYQPDDEIIKNSKASKRDPYLLSQRNNEKLNSIIEEVKHLLEFNSD